MQRLNDESPVWDLVICIAGGVGTAAWLFWAALAFKSYNILPWGNMLIVLSVLMAVLMLSTAISYWFQWKRRR